MKLIARNNSLILVSEESTTIYTGYDVFTGDLRHFLVKGSVDVTEVVKHLLNDEQARTQLAWSLGKTVKECADVMGVTNRTFQRLLNKHIYV